MGFWFSKMLNYFGEKEARILVLGLDNAGKTTILCTDIIIFREKFRKKRRMRNIVDFIV